MEPSKTRLHHRENKDCMKILTHFRFSLISLALYTSLHLLFPKSLICSRAIGALLSTALDRFLVKKLNFFLSSLMYYVNAQYIGFTEVEKNKMYCSVYVY